MSEGTRPVPLDEIFSESLIKHSRENHGIRGYWPRLVAKALDVRMGPILLFAPRRAASEELARQLAAELPVVEPLDLTSEQKRIAGNDVLVMARRQAVSTSNKALRYRLEQHWRMIDNQ